MAGNTPVIAVMGLQREARIAAGPGVLPLAGGGDSARLSRALKAAIGRGACGIISFGIAGGLQPGLAPGAWLVARAVVVGEERFVADPAWAAALRQALPGAEFADLAGVDLPVAQSGGKRALQEATGAAAVDMESHLVARIAAAHGLPFAGFRVIADPAERSLPAAALVGMKADGTTDVPAVLRALVAAPAELPALMRTALDARAAFSGLARGRRRLGLGLGFPNFG